MMQIIKNKKNWNNIINENFYKFKDIYFKFEYFNLYSKIYDVEPESIYWEDNYLKIFWSHLVRKINEIEAYKDFNYFDLITPYGYGGPLVEFKSKNRNLIKNSIEKFFKDYQNFAEKSRYICEFIRFHPLFKNWKPFEEIFEIQNLNDVVILNLTQNYEELWGNMRKNTRYYTKKALKDFKEIVIKENPSDNEISEFLKLYSETMDKNKASSKYYFSYDFIKDHFNFETLLIYCKDSAGIVAASSLFLKGEYIMHYHLSGTNSIFKNAPSNAVLWSAIEWAKQKGLKWFHFGGGRGANDSLFSFKKGFSDTYIPFHVGRIIFNNEIYQKLTSLNELFEKDSNFFPPYRMGYNKTIL